MGSWSGHTLPGSFFIAFGLFWAVKTSYRYFFSKPLGRPQRGCSSNNWDYVEACSKIIASTFGLIIEQVLPWEPHFHVVDVTTNEFGRANNWSHSTMYAFFLVSAVADILVMKFPKVMPHCTHHAALALALAVEGYLFYFHTHGREELDVRLHVLLLFAIWPSSIILLGLAMIDNNENMAVGYALLSQPTSTKSPSQKYASNGNETDALNSLLDGEFEPQECTLASSSHPLDNGAAKCHNNNEWTEMDSINCKKVDATATHFDQRRQRKKIFTLQLGNAIMFILHGIWFWQIASVLYPKNGKAWEQESHKNIAFATMFFTWYLLAAVTVVFMIFALFGLMSRRLRQKRGDYNPFQSEELP